MLLQFLFIVIGVALVLWGADRLTEGAASLARRLKATTRLTWPWVTSLAPTR